MSIRRTLISTALAVLALTVSTTPVLAQFTPRFSQQTRRAPGQMHIGLGTNVLNLGDYTSEPWPKLEAGIGLIHARLGFAIPLSGEKWFVLTEVEAPVTICVSTSNRIPCMPIGSLTPSWPSTR